MTTLNNLKRFLDDLAGQWTDPVLHGLRAAGVRQVTVDMEVETWRTLKNVLQAALRTRRAFPFNALEPLAAMRKQVVNKATALVARKFGMSAIFGEDETPMTRRTDFTTSLRSLGLETTL